MAIADETTTRELAVFWDTISALGVTEANQIVNDVPFRMTLAPGKALNLLGMPLWGPAGPNGFSDLSDAWSSPEGMKSRLDLAWFMGQRMHAPTDPLAAMKAVLGDTASGETSEAIAVVPNTAPASVPENLSVLVR